jgi:hypothetical protein
MRLPGDQRDRRHLRPHPQGVWLPGSAEPRKPISDEPARWDGNVIGPACPTFTTRGPAQCVEDGVPIATEKKQQSSREAFSRTVVPVVIRHAFERSQDNGAASRCRPLFFVFGRFVVYRMVAKSRSESGYKISGRRKYGRDFLLVNADANLIARSRQEDRQRRAPR